MTRAVLVEPVVDLVRGGQIREAEVMLDYALVKGWPPKLVDDLRADLAALVALRAAWGDLASVLQQAYNGPDGVGSWLRELARRTGRSRDRRTGEDMRTHAEGMLCAALAVAEVPR